MKTILNQSPYFSKLMGKQLFKRGTKYKKATYILFSESDGNILAFNGLTREFVILTNDELNLLQNYPCLEANDYSKELIEKWFVTPSDLDDNKLCEQLITVLQQLQSPMQRFDEYTILTTLDCNARCYYCYEMGCSRTAMTESTAYNVADFIIKNSVNSEKPIKITWFGGEPLYNDEVIDIICGKLTEANIKFDSLMISNGYLFSDFVIQKAKNNWRLNYVQITLDGTEHIYNKTKAYIYNDAQSPFQLVLDNINSLLNAGIRVNVRLNIGKNNVSDLHCLSELLHDKFSKYSNFSVYSMPLFDSVGKVKSLDEDRSNVNLEYQKLEKHLETLGISSNRMLRNSYVTHQCMADRDASIIITPTGELAKCEHFPESNLVGDICKGIISYDVVEEWKKRFPKTEICNDCPNFIDCIRLLNCPERAIHKCDSFEQQKVINKKKQKMSRTFQAWLSKQNNCTEDTEDGFIC